ncbi:hypothetical protein [Acinetobacter schindleri]|uniref:hypothetical protein n=1 Tax=Acinetobacter schindleri TaxID=108981 RepID=UPI002810BB95|nr:hypothetical protein [Acinetobacter schindleri]
MVTLKIRSLYQEMTEEQSSKFSGKDPIQDEERYISTSTPLYCPDEVLLKVQHAFEKGDPNLIRPVTDSAEDDIFDLEVDNFSVLDDGGNRFTLDEFQIFLHALKDSGKHYRSSEWCHTSQQEWVACDVYVFNLEYWTEGVNRPNYAEFYLKYCISSEGTVYLVCSCHFSKYR